MTRAQTAELCGELVDLLTRSGDIAGALQFKRMQRRYREKATRSRRALRLVK